MENEQTVYILYRIEGHRDREIDFIGVFTSWEKAVTALHEDRKSGKSEYHPDGWPASDYFIRAETVI